MRRLCRTNQFGSANKADKLVESLQITTYVTYTGLPLVKGIPSF